MDYIRSPRWERRFVMTTENWQNLVIGSGVAGKIMAWKLGEKGEKTVVVERSMIGGACPNVACLPSKNMVYSAKAVALANPKTGLGVIRGEMRVDMPAVVARKKRMVEELVRAHVKNYEASGAKLIMGEAKFVEPKTVEVKLNSGGTARLRGERVFIDVGTTAAVPDVPGMRDAGPMTHVEILNLERVPDHLIVMGGGYVGLEFAQIFRRFGSRVTIVQHAGQLLEPEDPDMAEALLQLMKDEGMDVLVNCDVVSVSGRSGERLELEVKQGGTQRRIAASDILVATGRIPNTDRLDVGKGNVKLDGRGYVQVNEHLQTSAPDVWAMGECAGSPKFTHVGEDDCFIVLDNLAGGNRTTRDRLIPYCLFTDPELAHVGMHESEAKAKGVAYRLVKQPMTAVLRTYPLSEPRGFAKALIGEDDRILGFTVFGAEASEMMAVVQTAMIGGVKYMALRDAVFTHPTMAEGLKGLFAGVKGK
jgi:pyruvate/2-oxoglutarate dehydrogenase complex dihydrolipoamide dehydrogenase (E3) component